MITKLVFSRLFGISGKDLTSGFAFLCDLDATHMLKSTAQTTNAFSWQMWLL